MAATIEIQFLSPGGCKSEVKVSAAVASPEASPQLGDSYLFPVCSHGLPSTCVHVCVQTSSSFKGRAHPSDLTLTLTSLKALSTNMVTF